MKPKKERETTVPEPVEQALSPFLSFRLIITGLGGLVGLTALAVAYGDTFWLWLQRSFEVSFIIYTAAVIYGIYKYLPMVASALTGGFIGTLNQLFKSQFFKGLGEKGVEAREFLSAMPGEGGIVKALLAEAAGNFVSERWGRKAAERVAAQISMIPLDLDGIVWSNLPQIAEKLGGFAGKAGEAKALAEELKMLGKVVPKE